MKLYYFSEMPHHEYPDAEGEKYPSLRLEFPNRFFDREKAHANYQRYLTEYEFADQVGFDGLMVNEHHSTPSCVNVGVNMSAAILARTTRRAKILLLGNILPIEENPVRLAEQIAMSDLISGGRVLSGFVRGVGVEQWWSNVNPMHNRERFEECHDLILKCWTEPGPFRWEGRHYHFRHVNPWCLPLQKPHPPIWIPGTASPETAIWAGRRGYTFVPFLVPFDIARELFDYYRQGAAEVGREVTPDKLGFLICAVTADTKTKALEAGRHFVWRMGASRGVAVSARLVIAWLIGGGVLASTLAHAQPAPGVTAEERAAARREGQVTYYTARTTVTANTIAKKAGEALGIKVNIVRLASTLVFNRAVQEFDAGINAADVIDTSVTDHFVAMKKKGMLQPFTPSSIAKFTNPAYYDPEHYWHASQIGLGAINYNPQLVKDPPKSWKELTDPKFKDKLVQGHVKASGTSLLLDYWLVKLYGWDYFKGLQKNNIMTHQSCDQSNLVASGERVILLCDHQITVPAQSRSLPVETVFPEDGVIAQIGGMGILKKAPRPNAARLLVDWCLSPEGQQVYVDSGLMSAVNDPKIKYPSKYPHPATLKLLVADPADVGRMLPELREKFSELFGG